MIKLDPEDFTLVDRLVAALYRGELERAREFVAEQRKAWELKAAEDEAASRSSATKARRELENVWWFETKDGLRVKGRIAGSGTIPPVWMRACRPKLSEHSIESKIPDLIEVRTYEHQDFERDGLPVFREV